MEETTFKKQAWKRNDILPILDSIWAPFGFILGACWAPFLIQDRVKWADANPDRGLLEPTGRRRPPGVPPGPQNDSQMAPLRPHSDPKGTKLDLKINENCKLFHAKFNQQNDGHNIKPMSYQEKWA